MGVSGEPHAKPSKSFPTPSTARPGPTTINRRCSSYLATELKCTPALQPCHRALAPILGHRKAPLILASNLDFKPGWAQG